MSEGARLIIWSTTRDRVRQRTTKSARHMAKFADMPHAA